MLNTIKLYHWKTYSYATHKATDDLYSKIGENQFSLNLPASFKVYLLQNQTLEFPFRLDLLHFLENFS